MEKQINYQLFDLAEGQLLLEKSIDSEKEDFNLEFKTVFITADDVKIEAKASISFPDREKMDNAFNKVDYEHATGLWSELIKPVLNCIKEDES